MENSTTATRITVITREGKTHDGKTFTAYKVVVGGGKLVDLRWKKEVDTRAFAGMNKFTVVVHDYSDASARYEYPRIYAGQIETDSVVKIF